jgi:hypothetical protein
MQIIRDNNDNAFRVIREIPKSTESEENFYKELYCVDTVLHINNRYFLVDTIIDAEIVP